MFPKEALRRVKTRRKGNQRKQPPLMKPKVFIFVCLCLGMGSFSGQAQDGKWPLEAKTIVSIQKNGRAVGTCAIKVPLNWLMACSPIFTLAEPSRCNKCNGGRVDCLVSEEIKSWKYDFQSKAARSS